MDIDVGTILTCELPIFPNKVCARGKPSLSDICWMLKKWCNGILSYKGYGLAQTWFKNVYNGWKHFMGIPDFNFNMKIPKEILVVVRAGVFLSSVKADAQIESVLAYSSRIKKTLFLRLDEASKSVQRFVWSKYIYSFRQNACIKLNYKDT